MSEAMNAEKYAMLILMMYDAGLENAHDFYKTNYGASVEGFGEKYISNCAKLDFNSSSSNAYQDLIDQHYSGEFGEGLFITKEQAQQILNSDAKECYTVRCMELKGDGRNDWGIVTADNFYTEYNAQTYILLSGSSSPAASDQLQVSIKIELVGATCESLIEMLEHAAAAAKDGALCRLHSDGKSSYKFQSSMRLKVAV